MFAVVMVFSAALCGGDHLISLTSGDEHAHQSSVSCGMEQCVTLASKQAAGPMIAEKSPLSASPSEPMQDMRAIHVDVWFLTRHQNESTLQGSTKLYQRFCTYLI